MTAPDRASSRPALIAFDWSTVATVAALPAVRRAVTQWVDPLGLDEDEVGALQVVVSELVANAVEASRPDDLVSVRLIDRIDVVVVEVANPSGRSKPVPIPPMADPLASRGRGLAIVRSLSTGLVLAEVDGCTVARCEVPMSP